MEYLHTLWLLFGIFLFLLSSKQIQCLSTFCKGSISLSEYEALEALYFATNGDFWLWKNLTEFGSHWFFGNGSSADYSRPCAQNWQGISCMPLNTPEDCYVDSLILSGYNLDGYLPPNLSGLKNMSILVLSNNRITGSIPISLGNLSYLEVLDIQSNSITGSIPVSFGNLSMLTDLEFYSNLLSRSLPSTIGHAMQLILLAGYDNFLTGPLPGSIGLLSSLEELYLDGNYLTSTLPVSIGDQLYLTAFQIFHNFLSGLCYSPSYYQEILEKYLSINLGTIPTEFGNLRELRYGLALLLNYLSNEIIILADNDRISSVIITNSNLFDA